MLGHCKDCPPAFRSPGRASGRLGRAALLAGILLGASPGLAAGQGLVAGVDLLTSNRLVWRGLTRVSGWSLQGDLFVSKAVGRGFLTAGSWGVVEPDRPRGNDLTIAGNGGRRLSELDPWLEYRTWLGDIDVAVGGTYYGYRGNAAGGGLGAGARTTELYTRVQLTRSGFAPSLSVSYDLDQVDGFYLEAASRFSVLANPLGRPFWAVYLRLSSGLSLGQGRSDDPSDRQNFAENGLTHVAGTASFNLNIPGIHDLGRLYLEGTAQYNRDPLTRWTSRATNERDHRLKAWFSVGFSATVPAFPTGET